MSRSYSSGSSSAWSSRPHAGSNASSVKSLPISSSQSKLKETLQDALYDEVPVQQFVQHVWGLPSPDTRRILEKMDDWDLPQPLLEEYKDTFTKMNENGSGLRRGRNVFSAFLDIVEEVLCDVRIRVNDSRRPTNCVAFKFDTGNEKTNTPDIATVWDATSKVEWSIIQTVFEFKKSAGGDQSGHHITSETFVPAEDDGSIPRYTSSSSSSSSSSSGSSSPSRDSISSSASASSSCATNASSSSSRTGRRRRVKSQSNNSMTIRRSSHSGKNRIASGELRLAEKALECINSTCRRYMTGVYVDNCSMTLWYYDRMSAVRSRSFDFERSPAHFALVLYAITRCDAYQAGFDRFLEFPSTNFRTQIPATNLRNSRLFVPTSSSTYCFQISREKPVYMSRELLGRGTVVYPVTLQPDEDEVLVDQEEQVLKLYWPNVDDPCEADLINQLHRDVPEIANHLPAISFSASFNRDDLDLPSFRLGSLAGPNAEERLLHMFTMRRYERLWEVNSIEEFQEVFIDCVECHHHAYKKGCVLHRDLSENNLMVWRPRRNTDHRGPGRLPSSGRALGILNDWDMSSRVVRYPGMASVVTMVTNDYSPLAAEAEALTNRTGTVPFMALDLLNEDGPTPKHLYRHDLESFLWILIWAAVHYDFPSKKNLSSSQQGIDEELKIWDEGTREQVWASKRALLRRVCDDGSPRSSNSSNDDFKEDVLDRVRPEFQKLKTEWIVPLIRLFHRAYSELRYVNVDEETCGGIVTFDTFMAAVNRKPRLVPSRDEDGWPCIIA